MPHAIRIAIMLGALAAGAAAVPARAQTGGGGPAGGGGASSGGSAGGATGGATSGFGSSGTHDPSSRLVRPGDIRPPPFPETYRRDAPAAPPSWSPQPAPGAKQPSPGGGIMTERQARDRIVGAGYTNVRTLRPTYSGSWTGQAYMRGSPVRVTVDARGNITTDHSDAYR